MTTIKIAADAEIPIATKRYTLPLDEQEIEVHTSWSIPPRERPVAAPAHTARVAYRTHFGNTMEYSYFVTRAEACRKHRTLRRHGVMATVEYWHATEHRWVG